LLPARIADTPLRAACAISETSFSSVTRRNPMPMARAA